MSEYYILKKVECPVCHSTGSKRARGYDTIGKEYTHEVDCPNCKGIGHTHIPIELNEELINKIRKGFMEIHNA